MKNYTLVEEVLCLGCGQSFTSDNKKYIENQRKEHKNHRGFLGVGMCKINYLTGKIEKIGKIENI